MRIAVKCSQHWSEITGKGFDHPEPLVQKGHHKAIQRMKPGSPEFFDVTKRMANDLARDHRS
jgi:hypothetical protein